MVPFYNTVALLLYYAEGVYYARTIKPPTVQVNIVCSDAAAYGGGAGAGALSFSLSSHCPEGFHTPYPAP